MPPEQEVLEKPGTTDKTADKGTTETTDKGASDIGAKEAAEKAATDKVAADTAADKSKKADKPVSSVFDDLDDDDSDGGDTGADKSKTTKKAETDDKAGEDKSETADKDETADEKRDRLAADTAWRDRIANRLLEPLKDKLSAKKFAERREALINTLKRSKSMDDAVINGLQAQEKLRSGDHKKLDADATPEEKAEWLKENGIPEKPEAYEIPKVAGHEWSTADQPMIDGFKGVAHNAGLNQAQVNALVDWQVKNNQRIEAEYEGKLKSADRQDKTACHDALRAEFGLAEFKPNMEIMKRLTDDDEVFGPVKDQLVSARYFNVETGTWHRLTSNPAFARAMISLATDRYGEGAMAAGDGRVAATNRRAEIETVMKTDHARYVREGMADELMKLAQADEQRAAKRR